MPIPCFIRVRWLLVAVLALCATAGSARAEATDAVERRTDRESRAVLRTLIADEIKNRKPCDFSNEWLSDARIGVEDAQKFLGLNLRAEVAAPYDVRSVTDILGPDGEMASSFCDGEKLKEQRRQLVEDFETGEIEGEVPFYGGSGRELKLWRITIGRPVFDRALKTAVLIVSFETLTRRRDLKEAEKYPHLYGPNGVTKRATLFLVGTRYVYRKRGTEWVKVDEREVFTGG
jgi:hypothetical protein